MRAGPLAEREPVSGGGGLAGLMIMLPFSFLMLSTISERLFSFVSVF